MGHRAFITVVTTCAIVYFALGSAESKKSTFNVGVVYWKQQCGAPGAATRPGPVPAPVTAGTLVLSRGGQSTAPIILTNNPARASIGGTGPIQATLVLETPEIQVVEGQGNSGPQRLHLSDAVEDTGNVTFDVLQSDSAGNGHVNVLLQLQRAADVAALASPKQLSPVTARVYDGNIASRPGLKLETPNTIHVGQTDGSDAQWEPDAMAHEYGHFVLESVAPAGPDNGDAHHIGKSYHDRRNLSWSEGFAAAFAAVVDSEGAGEIFKNCDHYQNLATTPARPKLESKEDVRYSQYNESRVGAATYQLINHLGKGVAGLKALLEALPKYQRDRHSVWTTRDLRDLEVQEFEKTADDHADLTRIFLGQGISWQQGFSFSLDDHPDLPSAANYEVAVSVTGPGGFACRVTSDVDNPHLSTLDEGLKVMGIKAADGGLSFSADDDCYLVSGDGVSFWFFPVPRIGGRRGHDALPVSTGPRALAGEF